MKSFQGKVAVITGAGSGIGRSLALRLNQAGAHLALCDIDGFGISETLNLLKNKSLAASIHIVDVSDQRQMQQFAVDVITSGQTSGSKISTELKERCNISIPARTVRHHLAQMGLREIKQTLPQLLAGVKKISSNYSST